MAPISSPKLTLVSRLSRSQLTNTSYAFQSSHSSCLASHLRFPLFIPTTHPRPLVSISAIYTTLPTPSQIVLAMFSMVWFGVFSFWVFFPPLSALCKFPDASGYFHSLMHNKSFPLMGQTSQQLLYKALVHNGVTLQTLNCEPEKGCTQSSVTTKQLCFNDFKRISKTTLN